MTPEQALHRYAELRLAIAHRLMVMRNWNETTKEQHRKDMQEQDAILAEFHSTYLFDMESLRAKAAEKSE